MTVLDYGSGVRQDAQTARGHWLGWAVYLGMSWTWCIGMFLPVLLVREYGIWGWVVFAIPNVIGAAAMGWVLRDAAASERIVVAHGKACTAFSIATVAFQVFFLSWFDSLFVGFALATACATAVVYSLLAIRDKLELLVAGLVFLASMCCFVGYLVGVVRIVDGPVRLPPTGPLSTDLLSLMPVMCYGFLLCPYLDLTFHRARQRTEEQKGIWTFMVGFGLFFLSMILFTLAYTTDLPLTRFVTRLSHEPWLHLSLLGSLVGLHMVIQLGFTIAVHARSLALRSDRKKRAIVACAIAAIAAVGLGTMAHNRAWIRINGISSGEFIYRLFMAFYGLVFPTYVWICMIPTWRTPAAPSRRMWMVFGVAVLLASPFYWIGFIEGKMLWLLPGLLIVLAARAFVPWRRTGEAAYN